MNTAETRHLSIPHAVHAALKKILCSTLYLYFNNIFKVHSYMYPFLRVMWEQISPAFNASNKTFTYKTLRNVFLYTKISHLLNNVNHPCSPHSRCPSNSYQAFENFVYITSVLGVSTGIEVVGGVLDALAFLTSDALTTIFLAMLEPGFSSTFVKP